MLILNIQSDFVFKFVLFKVLSLTLICFPFLLKETWPVLVFYQSPLPASLICTLGAVVFPECNGPPSKITNILKVGTSLIFPTTEWWAKGAMMQELHLCNIDCLNILEAEGSMCSLGLTISWNGNKELVFSKTTGLTSALPFSSRCIYRWNIKMSTCLAVRSPIHNHNHIKETTMAWNIYQTCIYRPMY